MSNGDGGGRDGRGPLQRIADHFRESRESLPEEVRNPPQPHEMAMDAVRAGEAFWANSLRTQLTGDYDQPYDPNLTYSQAYEQAGVPSEIAGVLGFANSTMEPGPGELADAARIALPALATALPRDLLDRLAGFTQILDEFRQPARQLHGTGEAFDLPDPSKFNPETLFGRGFYTTEGYYPSRGHPAPMDRWTDQPVPYDPTLELTTDKYARNARSANPNATPQVHTSYLDARNPFDFNAIPDDPLALGREIIAGTGLTGRRRVEAENRLAEIVEGIPSHAQFGQGGHPGHITAGDVMSAAQSAMMGWSGGYFPEAARGVYGMGHDAIGIRSNIAGSPIFSGPRAWHVPSVDQIIPAGNVPLAAEQMVRRGILQPDDPLLRDLGELSARHVSPTAPTRPAPVARQRPPESITRENAPDFVNSLAQDAGLREIWESDVRDFYDEGTRLEDVIRYPISHDIDIWGRPVSFDEAIDQTIRYLRDDVGLNENLIREAIDRVWEYDDVWN